MQVNCRISIQFSSGSIINVRFNFNIVNRFFQHEFVLSHLRTRLYSLRRMENRNFIWNQLTIILTILIVSEFIESLSKKRKHKKLYEALSQLYPSFQAQQVTLSEALSLSSLSIQCVSILRHRAIDKEDLKECSTYDMMPC